MKEIPGLSALSMAVPETSAGGKTVSAFTQVTERLGTAICDGTLAAGSVLTVEDLQAVTGASRSVVRESTRVLASMGLLRARKRIGLEVLDHSAWSLLDPQVIRWRLGSSSRQEQLVSLQELRIAIEPEAARLAAERCPPELAGQIMSAAGRLWAAGIDGGQDEFLHDDAQFHRLVLHASGNLMFSQLSDVIHEALRERTLHEQRISLDDVQLHVDLAGQIQRRQGKAAWDTMREIIRRTQSVEHLYPDTISRTNAQTSETQSMT